VTGGGGSVCVSVCQCSGIPAAAPIGARARRRFAVTRARWPPAWSGSGQAVRDKRGCAWLCSGLGAAPADGRQPTARCVRSCCRGTRRANCCRRGGVGARANGALQAAAACPRRRAAASADSPPPAVGGRWPDGAREPTCGLHSLHRGSGIRTRGRTPTGAAVPSSPRAPGGQVASSSAPCRLGQGRPRPHAAKRCRTPAGAGGLGQMPPAGIPGRQGEKSCSRAVRAINSTSSSSRFNPPFSAPSLSLGTPETTQGQPARPTRTPPRCASSPSSPPSSSWRPPRPAPRTRLPTRAPMSVGAPTPGPPGHWERPGGRARRRGGPEGAWVPREGRRGGGRALPGGIRCWRQLPSAGRPRGQSWHASSAPANLYQPSCSNPAPWLAPRAQAQRARRAYPGLALPPLVPAAPPRPPPQATSCSPLLVTSPRRLLPSPAKAQHPPGHPSPAHLPRSPGTLPSPRPLSRATCLRARRPRPQAAS
jgi:hypothetical protein